MILEAFLKQRAASPHLPASRRTTPLLLRLTGERVCKLLRGTIATTGGVFGRSARGAMASCAFLGLDAQIDAPSSRIRHASSLKLSRIFAMHTLYGIVETKRSCGYILHI